MVNALYDGLMKRGQRDQDAVFAKMQDGRFYTYADIEDVSARFAMKLKKLGLKPDDRLAVQVEKCIEALMLYLAAVRLGAIFLPLNTAYTAREIDYFLGDAKPTIFIISPEKEEAFKPLAEKHHCILETMGVWSNDKDDFGSFFKDVPESAAKFENTPRAGNDLAAILYTSGTTGRSKGAMLSHNNLLSNAKVLSDYWAFSKTDILLHVLPIYHTHGLFIATNTILVAGASMLFHTAFKVEDVVKDIKNATTMMGVPTYYTRLLAYKGFTRDKAEHMRLFISGSAPLLAQTHKEFEERTGKRILERYGMTETCMNTSNPYKGERLTGSVGFPLPGVEVKIAERETATPLERGEIGVIEVKGPNVFQGYWGMPEKTQEEFRPDGFFITGDLGYIDQEGYVTLIGRDKDLIISGGLNIYPKEVESVLDEIHGIKESAVIGVSHRDFGESVVAVIVAENPDSVFITDIENHLKNKLARFKQPKHYEIIEELPRNTMGKVQKNVLREMFGKIFG